MSDAAELEARHLLLSMQDRLTRDPYEGLGIGTASTPPEIRSAFLELTKTYHPARFGRMSHELQRLANEVFLALRGAHDSLAKPARPPSRPSPVSAQPQSTRASTAPVVSRTSTGPILSRTQTGPLPVPRPTSGVPGAVRVPTGQVPVTPRTLTPPVATSASPPTRPGQPRVPSQSIPTVAATASRPVQASAIPSTVKFATATRPSSPSGPAPTTSALPTTARPNEPELAPVHDLIQRGQWDAARVNLQALLARQPSSPRYHSLVAFVRGRKAQLENRIDEARAELARSLQLDPELAAAKSALAELFARRR